MMASNHSFLAAGFLALTDDRRSPTRGPARGGSDSAAGARGYPRRAPSGRCPAPAGVHYATPHSRSASMARWSLARHRSLLLVVIAVAAIALVGPLAHAQSDVRSPLPAPVKVKLGMTNVPALSPLWLLPDSAAKYQ